METSDLAEHTNVAAALLSAMANPKRLLILTSLVKGEVPVGVLATQVGLSQDDWKKGRDRKKGVGMRLYLSTSQNVDEIAKRAKNAGFTLKSEPQNTEWKTRAFEVTDPSGFLLTISSEAAT